jgi:DNA-binding CsgD family transcriptional regulator
MINTGDFIYPSDDLKRSEFYADWLRPQGINGGCFLIVRKDALSTSVLTFLQPDESIALADPLPRALSVLSPHLMRAIRIMREDHGARSLHQALVEGLSLAVVYLTDERRLVYANHRARDLLARGHGIRTQASGQLHLADREADDAIAAVLRAEGGQARVGVARVRRASGRPLQVLLIRPALDAAERFFIGGRLILLLNDPDDPAQADAASPATAYGLSPAEQRLAQGLLDGQRLDEMAESWRLSKQTLRTQLASALAKMGVRSQAELVREGMQSPSSRIEDP